MKIGKMMMAGILCWQGMLLGAQELSPVLSYSFEKEEATDDAGRFSGRLVGNARIVEMTDGNKVLHTHEGYMDLGIRGRQIAEHFKGDYSLSIDLLVRPENGLDQYKWLLAFVSGTDKYLGLINSAGNKDWLFEVKDKEAERVNSGQGLQADKWYNLSVVKQGRTITFFIDGKAAGAKEVEGQVDEVLQHTWAAYIGRSPFAADHNMRNVLVDNLHFYDKALSKAQIKTLNKNTRRLASTTEVDLEPAIMHRWQATGNPIVTHKYTADPAALVYNDTLFIYAGEDYEGGQRGYNIKNWTVFATTDMLNFWEYKVPLRATDFSWGESNAAWASQVIERNGKFYWYTSSQTTGIGVAVSDRPEGPFKDALGRPLLTNDDSFGREHSWRTIDPSVFIDDDGQAWLYWGNGACWVVKLNEDMISYDKAYGVKMVDIEGEMEFPFTEAPWVHKKDGLYFLSYAIGFPERIAYAVSDQPEGPYTYKGIINEIAGNSNTNHQAIVEFKGQWYFIYHNGGIQTDGSGHSRSVCIDKLEFDEEGFYKPINMTTKGVAPIK